MDQGNTAVGKKIPDYVKFLMIAESQPGKP